MKIQWYILIALFFFSACRKSETLRSSNGLEKWQITTLAGYDGQPAISRDGRYVVHSSTQAGDPHIWLYDVHEQSRTPLTANEGRDEFPSFSADDRWIVFSSVIENRSDLWLLSQDGDLVAVTKSADRDEWAPTFADHDSSIVCVVHDSIGYGLARIDRYNVSDFTVFYRDSAQLDRPSVHAASVYFQRLVGDHNDIVRWDRHSKKVSTVVNTPGDEIDPAVSPDGRWLAYARKKNDGTFFQIQLMNLEDSRQITMAPESEDQRYPAWAGDGSRILYEGRSKWLIKRMDVATQVDSIVVQSDGHIMHPVVRADHQLVYVESSGGRHVLRQMDLANGHTTDIPTQDIHPDEPDISPDGRWLAWTGWVGDQCDVYAMPLGTPDQAVVKMTDNGSSFRPRFSNDGKKVFYSSSVNGSEDIWEFDMETKERQVLTVDDKKESDPSAGPDGFVMFAADWANRWSVWQMPQAGGMPLPLTRDKTPYGWDREPVLSPDGKFVLFTRSWYDDADIWLMRTDGGEKSTRTLSKDNTNQETNGRWTADGKFVYYQSGNNVDVWMVNIEPLMNRD